MAWKPLKIREEEIREFERTFKKKSRFIVDESLGIGTTELIYELGYNVIDVSEIGLKGQSDENVFNAAWREDRILLTHDIHFLNERRFPQYRNPGIVILPGSKGDERKLLNAIFEMLSLIGKYRELWRHTKLVFKENGDVLTIGRNLRTGTIEKKTYRFPRDGSLLLWEDES
jgi:predicted nuclease of predicted toxin-antitoxin system